MTTKILALVLLAMPLFAAAQTNEKLTWPITVSIDELLKQFEQIAKENKITIV